MKEHESDVNVCENQQLLVPENFDDPVPEVTALVSDWVEEEVETSTVNDEDTSMIQANFSVQEMGAITVFNTENCNQVTESNMAADQTWQLIRHHVVQMLVITHQAMMKLQQLPPSFLQQQQPHLYYL